MPVRRYNAQISHALSDEFLCSASAGRGRPYLCCNIVGVNLQQPQRWAGCCGLRLTSRKTSTTTALARPEAGARMAFLSIIYRFVTNFAFLAVVYFSLNFMEKYPNRAVLAILVLVYSAMRAASTLRAFYFFQKIEKLEAETRRLQAPINDGGGGTAARKQIVTDVARLRRDGELKSYMDLFFLALIVLLCVAAIMRQ
jgi:hypothetical protein